MEHRTEQAPETIKLTDLAIRSVPAVFTIALTLLALNGDFYITATREYTGHAQPYTNSTRDGLPLTSRGLYDTSDFGVSALLLVIFFSVEKPPEALRHLISAANAYGLQYIIVGGIKESVGALRPNGGFGSFPSEHAGSAAALCFYGLEYVLSMQTGTVYEYLMQVVASFFFMAYPWFVAGMRMLGSYHYAVDVTAGVFIGAVSGWMAFAYQRNYIGERKYAKIGQGI